MVDWGKELFIKKKNKVKQKINVMKLFLIK